MSQRETKLIDYTIVSGNKTPPGESMSLILAHQ